MTQVEKLQIEIILSNLAGYKLMTNDELIFVCGKAEQYLKFMIKDSDVEVI